MIPLTRFDGTTVIVNLDLVQWIEQTPDTAIVLATGERLLVRERPDQVVRLALEFKRAVASGPADCPHDPAAMEG